MKEMEDKDFDKFFRERMTEGLPPFEEESWRMMQEKLDQKDRRDRFLFYRNASIILLFLSFGLGFYLINKKEPTKKLAHAIQIPISNKKNIEETPAQENGNIILPKNSGTVLAHLTPKLAYKKSKEYVAVSNPVLNSSTKKYKDLVPVVNDTAVYTSGLVASADPDNVTAQRNEITGQSLTHKEVATAKKTKKKNAKKIPFMVAFSFGPDFNSTNSVIGGKGNIAVGLSIGFGVFKNLSLQTGINYGSKNYTANNYDYTFANPNVASKIASIDAACKVLEIPLRASFQLFDLKKSSINLNLGLSSYFMLKEDYNFIYTAASGRPDRLVEKKNANQHYLSVIDLSATYNIKLKSKKFDFGIEPYLKIPMSGIGEGNVPLKSSGISLKLGYELKFQ
nr:hypothetical protein [uncultured Pedobacter sp.]